MNPPALRRRQRGAAVVETAVVTALVAIALITVIDRLHDQTGSSIDDNGDRIGTPTEYSENPVTTIP